MVHTTHCLWLRYQVFNLIFEKLMVLELVRTYFPNGTNGELSLDGVRISSTIELPWLNNKTQVSCIPEGKYELMKRCSARFGWHLQVMNVKNRAMILIHPANDAKKELRGCIAPVTILQAEGKGLRSRIAFEKLKALVYRALEQKKQVFLMIRSEGL